MALRHVSTRCLFATRIMPILAKDFKQIPREPFKLATKTFFEDAASFLPAALGGWRSEDFADLNEEFVYKMTYCPMGYFSTKCE